MKTFRLTIIVFSLISLAFCSDVADDITAADGFVGVGARAAAMGALTSHWHRIIPHYSIILQCCPMYTNTK